MEENTVLPVSVYAEMTPNPATMKFVANQLLLESGNVEINSVEDAVISPLAERIFNFPFVEGIYMSGNFITVTKNDLVEWQDVFQDLREYIQNYLRDGKPVFAENVIVGGTPDSESETPGTSHLTGAHKTPDGEVEEKIISVLEEYVRPAVESDGGSIFFKSFKDGVLTVSMKGSCSGCPSSTVTLKNGVQSLMQRMVPEVVDVIADQD